MTLPRLLIIGSMKAGTTTLFRDLLLNPAVFFPLDKEPESLCSDGVFTPAGRRAYEDLFARATPGQLCAEASTAYTKRPDFEGVAARAVRLLGGDIRVLYIVRDPVKRLVSQHRHELQVGRLECRPDVNDAVREQGRYLDYSRYAMQLEPWLEALGPERVRVVLFEQYVKARAPTIVAVSEFLGLEPAVGGLDEGRVFNKGDDRRVVRGPWRWFLHGRLYKRYLRPLLGGELRQRLHGVLLPKAAPVESALSPESEAWVRGELAPDIRRFAAMVDEHGLGLPAGGFGGWGMLGEGRSPRIGANSAEPGADTVLRAPGRHEPGAGPRTDQIQNTSGETR
ncbi:MAG: sulfotransferase [Phycisphaerales bacterium]|nr:sulfotransferase [Phycisphaerales bacterium]